MLRKLPILLILLLFLGVQAASADHEGLRLLGTAWPDANVPRLGDIGRGVGVVFSPDLSVSGNCRFYQALGFACFQDADWSRVIDQIHQYNVAHPDRRVYTLNCNWKVYVDNYLDGGYHVPHAHKELSSVIEYTQYTIENFERACLQSSPLSSGSNSVAGVAATRQGRAFYLWIYPNFMINAYEGVMDTNLVVPLAVDKCAVIFDYYFADISQAAGTHNRQSIAVSEKVQDEDMAICDSVQRGLSSRAYVAGRLSVRREAGEHLFHRLLHADLTAALRH